MAQTLVSLLVHAIFSTKNREPFITTEIEPELFAYMGGILNNNGCRLLDAGGTADHVHLLVSQSKNIALAANFEIFTGKMGLERSRSGLVRSEA